MRKLANPISCLPHDLEVEILSRSPVKSLLRFKCVCKSWLALISDPQFTKSQFDLAAAVTHRVLLKRCDTVSEIQSLDVEASLDDDSAIVNLTLPPGTVRDPMFQIFGSCRGFVFLTDAQFSAITVWNPSTGAHMKIPVLYLHSERAPVRKGIAIYHPGIWYNFLLGIGYEESSDDYLVVVIRLQDLLQIQVFSLKTNVSSIVHDVDVHSQYWNEGDDFRPGILFNESLHWLVYSYATKFEVVLAFDLIHRSLFEMPLTPDLAMELAYGKVYHLNVMDGYLCLCYGGDVDLDKNVEIWVMKKYKVTSSWTKSFVLLLTSVPDNKFVPSCFTRCGDLFGSRAYGELVKINLNDKGHIVEYRSCLSCKKFVGHFHFYRESLLPLPQYKESRGGGVTFP
ncbi:F-box/kelch-repeat protein At3g06240-like [Lotus japonicus]|uniref:F-box/kelch-repeat protein At3g06240-like n=1 Tax=Lotus japonicus TaxID=34305 RepID=UPI002583C26F|nr:F-box/kelch-repeat protein At3g06240-like [Lotus japonicus]